MDAIGNHRFGLMAYYEGVKHCGPGVFQVWTGRDVGISTPTDRGFTLLAVFPHQDHRNAFRADPARALEDFMTQLPDGPDLSEARRTSKVAQAYDYPQIRRDPTPRPGLALVGDAATTGDPVPAVGCGWAFRSGEWLADATAPALRAEAHLRRGLAGYRRAHRFIARHDNLCRKESAATPPGRPEQLILAAMAHDPRLRRTVYLTRMRALPVSALINPVTLARAAVTVLLRARARRPHNRSTTRRTGTV